MVSVTEMSGGGVQQHVESIDANTKPAKQIPPLNSTTTTESTKTAAVVSAQQRPEDGTGVIRSDPWLQPFVDSLKYRYSYYLQWMERIESSVTGGLDQFSRGYEYFGLNYSHKDHGLYYREWAPNAQQAYFIGDFSKFQLLCVLAVIIRVYTTCIVCRSMESPVASHEA